MDKAGTITMTMRALDRMKVIQALVDGTLRPNLAVERLGVTVRQVRRLAKRYREEGPSGRVSRRCDRLSNSHKAADISGLALSVIRGALRRLRPGLHCREASLRADCVRRKSTSHATGASVSAN